MRVVLTCVAIFTIIDFSACNAQRDFVETNAQHLFVFMQAGDEAADIFDDEFLYNARPLINELGVGFNSFNSDESLDCVMSEGQFLGPLGASCGTVTFVSHICKAKKHGAYSRNFEEVTADVVALSACTEDLVRQKSAHCLSLKENIQKYFPMANRIVVHAWEEYDFDARLWDDYWEDQDKFLLSSTTGVEVHFLLSRVRIFKRNNDNESDDLLDTWPHNKALASYPPDTRDILRVTFACCTIMKSQAENDLPTMEDQGRTKLALNEAMHLWESSFSAEAQAGSAGVDATPIKPFYESEGRARGYLQQRQANKKKHKSRSK